MWSLREESSINLRERLLEAKHAARRAGSPANPCPTRPATATSRRIAVSTTSTTRSLSSATTSTCCSTRRSVVASRPPPFSSTDTENRRDVRRNSDNALSHARHMTPTAAASVGARRRRPSPPTDGSHGRAVSKNLGRCAPAGCSATSGRSPETPGSLPSIPGPEGERQWSAASLRRSDRLLDLIACDEPAWLVARRQPAQYALGILYSLARLSETACRAGADRLGRDGPPQYLPLRCLSALQSRRRRQARMARCSMAACSVRLGQ